MDAWTTPATFARAAGGTTSNERKAGEWRAEQDRIAEAIQDHLRADQSYADTGVRLLELASGAHAAFMSQGSDERRRRLQVVSNSSWKGGRLAVELHEPFDLILQGAPQRRGKRTPRTPARRSPGRNSKIGGRGGI